ncbi:MAG: hypothetical protein AB1430_03600 [Pseudomonadota bacterium]
MKLRPTLFTAALAGSVAGMAMPLLWLRLANDSVSLVIAFLLVVALPVHAFVVGFDRRRETQAGAVDTPLLKRGGAWLLAAVVTAAVTRGLYA